MNTIKIVMPMLRTRFPILMSFLCCLFLLASFYKCKRWKGWTPCGYSTQEQLNGCRWIVCWFNRAILNSCCSRSLASEKTSDLATCILLLVSRMYHSLHICDKDKSFRFEQIFIIVVTLRHIVTDHFMGMR